MDNTELINAVRGSLIGGAVGDALGYAVEFMREGNIFHEYGKSGITSYDLDFGKGKGRISDDTQMTLFTAEGLLHARIDSSISPRHHIAKAYQNWRLTQISSYWTSLVQIKISGSRLLQEEQLFARRAPGNTCMSALQAASHSASQPDDYIAHPSNDSKGCGGVMRVAPVALDPVLRSGLSIEEIDMEAAQAAAITHGHSLGYMPAAMLCHIISRIVFPEGERMPLKEIVFEARDTIAELFRGDSHLDELEDLVNDAVNLSENAKDDLENIHWLGEGWVAEETLAIAIYCALRYQNDFSKGIVAAVNHDGDSDSTGAVTGNILGALIGYDALDEKWKTNLELHDLTVEMADRICK